MTEQKIMSNRAEAAAWAEQQRKAGKKVAFTNGVFDLLHPGHLDSLRRARAEADVLIVGLNDDDSVRALKGEGRPILPLNQRQRLVAALECVDAVVSFSEDTPAELVEAIAPDVLVKGGDYPVDQIAGHEFVLARGGRVLSLPLLPGISTTGLVERIKERFLTPGQ
jgi:rfaE bifunctional protein nucleotidyltransferase chain/domain